MSWVALVQDDVAGRLTDPELTAVTTAAVKVGQTAEEILAAAISATTREIRGYVSANPKNVLGEGETIPDELTGAALALIRRYLYTRLPGTGRLLDENRRTETEDALNLLRDVAAGRFAVVGPATAASAQPAGPGVAVLSARDQVAKPSQTAGL